MTVELPNPTGPRFQIQLEWQPLQGPHAVKLAGPSDTLAAIHMLATAQQQLIEKMLRDRAAAKGKSNGVAATGDLSILEE